MNCESLFKIERYTIDQSSNSVFHETDGAVSLQPKTIEVLAELAHQYPEYVSRHHLIERVWDGNFYVGDKSLTNAIWNLRQSIALSDKSELIETKRKTGYRLLVQPKTGSSDSFIKKIGKSELIAPWFSSGIKRNILLFTLLVFISLFTALDFHQESELTQSKQQNFNHQIKSITTEPGREYFPSLSPGGRYLAYSWIRLDLTTELYLKDLQQPDLPAKRLTFNNINEGHTAWGKNGKYLYYALPDHEKSSCQYVRLNMVTMQEEHVISCELADSYYYLDISPDNKILAFHGKFAPDSASGIYFIALDNDEAKPERFSCSTDCAYSDRDIAFSKDGKKVALSRRTNRFVEDLYIVDLVTKQELKLTRNRQDIVGFSWHPDNLHIVFGVQHADTRQAYLYSSVDKEVISLNIPGFSFPSFSEDGSTLFYQHRNEKYEIASLELNEQGTKTPFPVIVSKYSHKSPDYSAMQNMLTYVSNESGNYELWKANIDGSERQQLTYLKRGVRYPKWSHDGKNIAFLAGNANGDGENIYTLEFASGKIKKLHSPFRKHGHPTWSNDDESIISSVKTDKFTDLFSFNIANNSNVRLTFNGGLYGVMTEKNQLFYTREGMGFWQLDLHEKHATPVQLMNKVEFAVTYSWGINNNNLYYHHLNEKYSLLKHFDLQLLGTKTVAKLPLMTFSDKQFSLSVAAENKVLFTNAQHPQADIKQLINLSIL